MVKIARIILAGTRIRVLTNYGIKVGVAFNGGFLIINFCIKRPIGYTGTISILRVLIKAPPTQAASGEEQGHKLAVKVGDNLRIYFGCLYNILRSRYDITRTERKRTYDMFFNDFQ